MLQFELKFKGLQKLYAIPKAIALSKQQMDRTLILVAEQYKGSARTWAPIGKYFNQEGQPIEPSHQRLHESIQRDSAPTALPDGAMIRVWMAPHGKFTLEPTRPHVIPTWRTARKMLAFYWVDAPPEVAVNWGRGPIGKGVWVVLPGVLHPGYKPTVRWDVRAWESIEPRMVEEFMKIGEVIVKTIREAPGGEVTIGAG